MTDPQPSTIDLARLRPELHDLIQEAGKIALDHFRQNPKRWDKAPDQPVTEADVAIDDFLRERLMALTAGDGVAWLSEETEDDPARLAARHVWIVDPIDGTRSFAEGKPEFTISVALVADGVPVLAALLNPAKDELFTAERGLGAMLNGEALRVSPCLALDGARIAVSEGEDRRAAFKRAFPEAEIVRIGSLAYKMAKVATGRFDAFFSRRKACDWDVAAGTLILEEAGGRVSDASGRPLSFNREETKHKGLVACTPGLHAALMAVAAKKSEARGEDET